MPHGIQSARHSYSETQEAPREGVKVNLLYGLALAGLWLFGFLYLVASVRQWREPIRELIRLAVFCFMVLLMLADWIGRYEFGQ